MVDHADMEGRSLELHNLDTHRAVSKIEALIRIEQLELYPMV